MTSRLQEELRQSRPFPRTSSEAMLGLMRTASVLEHALSEALRPHGLTVTQYNVLRILRGAGSAGLCGREIGERLVSKVPDVSRLLDRMEETGLVRRERDTEDRRHVTARLTPEGARRLEAATPVLEAEEEARFARLDEPTTRALIAALDALRGPG